MDETRVFKSYTGIHSSGAARYAYDYSAAGFYEDVAIPGRRRHPEHTAPKRSGVQEQTEAYDEVIERPISRRGQGISLLTLAGFAVAALLLMALLICHVQLTKLSDAAAAEQQLVTELTEQQHRLQAHYEQLFPLGEVERYATENLGMQKPDSDSIIYLEQLAPADVAVVINPRENSGKTSVLGEIVSVLRSYFR